MSLQFFNDTPKSSLESTGLSKDIVQEIVLSGLDEMRRQLSKMRTIRDSKPTENCAETLKQLSNKINNIFRPTVQHILDEPSMDKEVNPTSPRPS
ncbi:MAG: hypothetical protein H0U70_08575 [Tatlockia sp.]|nr:hypothetical protein [Tatlockia sp.]